MEFRIYSAFAELPSGTNTFLKDAPLFLQPGYLLALEKGKPPELDIKYILGFEKGKTVLFYQYHLVNLSQRSLHRIFYRQQYSRLLARFSAMITRYIFGVKEGRPHYLLVNGSVMISGPYYGWAKPGNESLLFTNLSPALKLLSDELNKSGKIVATVIKDIPETIKYNPAGGFSKVIMDPVMKLLIPSHWKTFEDYLSDLSAKYRLRYNNAMKKMTGVDVRDLEISELENERENINILYRNVQQRSPVRMLNPDAGYLEAIASMKQPGSFLKAFYYKKKMVLFMCGVFQHDHLEAHHVGMDYSLNKNLQLYQNMLYAFIREGIEHGAERISFGRTALEIKSTVGAVPFMYNAWIRMGNHVLNKLIRPFLPDEPADNWVQRNPFREGDSPKP